VIGVVVQRARDARKLVLRVLRRDDMVCVVFETRVGMEELWRAFCKSSTLT
jgi:hypothetical protein